MAVPTSGPRAAILVAVAVVAGCSLSRPATLTPAVLEAQGPDILGAVARFARADLGRQGIELDELVAFDVRVMRRRGLEPGTQAPFDELWSDAHVERAVAAGAMQPGTLDSVRTCMTLASGSESCTLRPTRAVVAASRPALGDNVALVNIHFWFQPRHLRYDPDTGEPMEIHHMRADLLELTRTRSGWTVTAQRKGPPGTSIGR